MRIVLNGETHDAPDGASVRLLLDHLGVPLQKVAVERNLSIVPKSTYAETMLEPGDRIEIVHFIGGG